MRGDRKEAYIARAEHFFQLTDNWVAPKGDVTCPRPYLNLKTEQAVDPKQCDSRGLTLDPDTVPGEREKSEGDADSHIQEA